MDTFVKSSLTELKKEVLTSYTEQQNWQLTFEDAQAKKIMEIQDALKVLNQNYLFI